MKFKRMLTIILCAALLITQIPTSAFAAEGAETIVNEVAEATVATAEEAAAETSPGVAEAAGETADTAAEDITADGESDVSGEVSETETAAEEPVIVIDADEATGASDVEETEVVIVPEEYSDDETKVVIISDEQLEQGTDSSIHYHITLRGIQYAGNYL